MKTLRKYYVENVVLNPAQWNGYEPYNMYETENYLGDSVTAESEEEAIVLAMDCLRENFFDNRNEVGNIDIDYDDRTMKVFNCDGELLTVYCNFYIRRSE